MEKPYLIVLYAVILRQNDLHLVPLLLHCPAQCSHHVPHAPHLNDMLAF